MTELDGLLPPGLAFEYLRVLAGVDIRWSITVSEADLPLDKASSLSTDANAQTAHITLNTHYIFPPRTLARALMHELMELVLISLWEIDLQLIGRLPHADQKVWTPRVRLARDQVIDSRLAAIPYWKSYDIPVPKEAVCS